MSFVPLAKWYDHRQTLSDVIPYLSCAVGLHVLHMGWPMFHP